MLFLEQTVPSSCGPIAVCNSARWARAPVVAFDHAHTLCECNDGGTSHDKIDSALHHVLYNHVFIKRVMYPTYECILDHIRQPHSAAVITMMYDANDGHTTLLTSAKGDLFWAVNFIPGEKSVARPIEYLQCVLSIRRQCADGYYYPHAWLLKRKQ